MMTSSLARVGEMNIHDGKEASSSSTSSGASFDGLTDRLPGGCFDNDDDNDDDADDDADADETAAGSGVDEEEASFLRRPSIAAKVGDSAFKTCWNQPNPSGTPSDHGERERERERERGRETKKDIF